MILLLETTVQLAYFTHCVTVHLSLNDKNTELQIRIKEKSSLPSKQLENWTSAKAPTHFGTEQFHAKLGGKMGNNHVFNQTTFKEHRQCRCLNLIRLHPLRPIKFSHDPRNCPRGLIWKKFSHGHHTVRGLECWSLDFMLPQGERGVSMLFHIWKKLIIPIS